MNDVQLLRSMRLFLAALPEERKRVIPSMTDSGLLDDQRAFARAVMRIRESNTVANNFRIQETSAGPRSDDFARGLSVALTVGLLSWISPEHTKFLVNLTPRQCEEVAKWDESFAEAKELAHEYLLETYGGRK